MPTRPGINHGLIAQQHAMSAGRYLDLIGRAHRDDAAMVNHDGLVFARLRAGAIQDENVLQVAHPLPVHALRDEWL